MWVLLSKGMEVIESSKFLGKKPRTKAPKIQRLVTPRVLQHKRRRIALKKQRTKKNKEETAEYAKLLAKRMKVNLSGKKELWDLHFLIQISFNCTLCFVLFCSGGQRKTAGTDCQETEAVLSESFYF